MTDEPEVLHLPAEVGKLNARLLAELSTLGYQLPPINPIIVARVETIVNLLIDTDEERKALDTATDIEIHKRLTELLRSARRASLVIPSGTPSA